MNIDSTTTHQELQAAIDQCMIRDRSRLLKALARKQGRSKLLQQIQESLQRVDMRRRAVPSVTFPEALPVSQRVSEISRAVQANQVVIIAGETGSGKTTQIPKICLSIGRGVHGMIGHTQPRRVAARTVAYRIADELAVTPGQQVGYQVRFTDETAPNTHIKVMTDGILLAETQTDRLLEGYDTLIIDEAHERSLNIDFMLGYLKRILPSRPDLKVIVTSATIDVDRFSKHFNDAPVIEVSGRMYPVTVHYRPLLAPGKNTDADELLYRGVLDVLREIEALEHGRQRSGDVLIFLPGEREIRELSLEIRKSGPAGFDVLPLYSRLSVAEQNRVFSSHAGKRIILATNVAETSLTVPGIRYVIDPGTARISRYSVRSKVQQLPIEAISQASARQRMGRCGRLSAGVCFRLYDIEDFESRPAFTTPEILRTNLAAVMLQMLTLRLGDMTKFPFLERPDQRQINDGYHLLRELQAVDEHKHLTRMGREIARLPVDLRLARMLIAAGQHGCLAEVLTIVSVLAIQDPRERPHEYRQAADEKHRQHWHEKSDFMALLQIWQFHEAQRQALTQNQLRRFCRENFLSFMRMREWRDNHRQLRLICKELGLRENTAPADFASIHRALLSGLLGNIGERGDEDEYLGAHNRRHFIFPGSSQYKRKPRWIMSFELVETTRLYGRQVADIDSRWIESMAGHLTKREHHEPFFDSERGQVFALEEVMLYGVTIVKRRKVDYGAVNPVRARQLFIQLGLVERQLVSTAGFFRHNGALMEEVLRLESKSRKRDILVDEFALYRFYDDRLPAHVVSGIELDVWCKVPDNDRQLYLCREDLMREDPSLSPALYPDFLVFAGTRLPLDYHFDPQHEHDGVSVEVPVAVLRQVSEERLDWLIPGLLRDKCLALIKSLPKSIRKNFVPAPEYADKVVVGLDFDGRRLPEVLAEKLFRLSGVAVDAAAFDAGEIERHLKMNIKVIGDQGEVLDSGRDLHALVQKFAGQVTAAFSRQRWHDIEVSGATDWQFGVIPDRVELQQSGVNLQGYPAIVDHGDTVSLEVIDHEWRAAELSRRGLLRLIMLQLKEPRKYLEKQYPALGRFSVYYATRGKREDLIADLVETAFRYTFIEDRPPVRSPDAFEIRLKEKQSLIANANLIGDLMVKVLQKAHAIDQRLNQTGQGLNETSYVSRDVREQLDDLLGGRFLKRTPFARLKHIPRYLDAIEYRLEKARGNLPRDKANTEDVQGFLARCKGSGDGDAGHRVTGHQATTVVRGGVQESEQVQNVQKVQEGQKMQEFRWLIQEYRVSLFAQPLGTSQPVSAKRLEKAWQEVVQSGR